MKKKDMQKMESIKVLLVVLWILMLLLIIFWQIFSWTDENGEYFGDCIAAKIDDLEVVSNKVG